MTATREQLLEAARRAALRAGEAILEVYATAFDVQQKTDNTPVTAADLAAERIIVTMLTEAAPGIPIASEELVEAEGLPPWASRFWVVDPLDGTKEFIARNGSSPFSSPWSRTGSRCLASSTARRSVSPTPPMGRGRPPVKRMVAARSRSAPARRARMGSS